MRQVVSPQMVGRDAELDRVLGVVAEPPAVVVVAGEAGVGKTRLVEELLASPTLSGSRRLVGRCQRIRESFPLGPLIEALRRVSDELRGLRLGAVAGALRPLLPELAQWLPAAPDPLDDRAAERHRMFRGLAEVLGALGSARPVVLVVEDLHWADEQTRDFIAYWLADPTPHASLVLTYRSEDADLDVSALTARLPAAIVSEHLTLAPLDAPTTGALVAAILDTDEVSAEFASYLWDRTGGLPLAVEEVLALVQARGLLVRTGHTWTRKSLDELDVPRGIRDPTLQRLARLPEAAQRVVEAAALLQTKAPMSVLLATTGPFGAADSGIAAVEQAIDSGLLVDDGHAIGFRHVLAAQSVYESLSGPRRYSLHARAAAALELLRPVPLSQVAYHLRGAGRLAEWALTAEAAADEATGLGHEEEATRLLADVLRRAPLDVEQRGRLAVKLGRAANETLHAGEVVDVLSEALEQDPPAALRGELRMVLANAVYHSGDDVRRQRRLLADAVTELDDRPDLQAQAMAALGFPYDLDAPIAQDVTWVRRSLALVDKVSDPQLQVYILGQAAGILVYAGEAGWREVADRVRERIGDAPRRRREVNACYNIGGSACYAGHLATAELFLDAGLRTPAGHENRRLDASLRSVRALLAYFRGEWSGLDGEVSGLIAEQAAYPYGRMDVDLVAGCLTLAHGDVDAAMRRLHEVVDLAERLGSLETLQCAGEALVRVSLSRGEVAGAVEVVRRCVVPLMRKDLWLPASRLLPSAMEAWLASRVVAEAQQFLERAEGRLRDLDAPLAPAALAYARGVLARSADDLLTAADRYDRLPAPHEAARARERAAGLLFDHDQASAAAIQLKRALATYEHLGATWDYDRAARAARGQGVKVPSRQRGGVRKKYGTALSPRERAVAALAATGRTNKEIAAELFVSTKTVDTHLSAAMRKLGVHSRTALAHRLSTADDGRNQVNSR
jgi:DNA-binding CsgD family transcriptional regulator